MARFRLPAWCALGLCPLLHGADSAPAVGIAPAQGWVLPLFTKEGYRKTNLSGDRVTPVTNDQFDVINIKILTFSGDASEKITSILLSPVASYFQKENRASGPSGVRLIRDDVEISGDGAWTYEQTEDKASVPPQTDEKISVHRNVRVSFKAQLNTLLK